MKNKLAIAIAQLNPIVGDIAGNAEKIVAAWESAAARGADIVLYSELVLSGYPPEDLVMKPSFMRHLKNAVEDICKRTASRKNGPALLLTTPWEFNGARYNAVLLIDGGTIETVRAKNDLPNYGVFDEKRVFAAGPMPDVVDFRGIKLGVPICEDVWTPHVVAHLAGRGAEFMLVPNGSPFEADKDGLRRQLIRDRVLECGLPMIYCNEVGGQDELVFDGGSFGLNAEGNLAVALPAFAESVQISNWLRDGDGKWYCDDAAPDARYPSGLDAIYQTLVLGLRDYVNKNGFPGVVIGMSGGIDSALSAAVAVDALGAERVRLAMMPSPYTSADSLEDAQICADMLKTGIESINIGPAMEAFGTMLAPAFAGRDPDIAEENIQARSRGIILMGLSNKFGHMVLTTGNKSEMSVGYATLYGDMCGGYSVLKDLYKTTVFALCHWRNAHCPQGVFGPDGMVIPERIITKPPSAELRPDQKDEDSLPPYDVLDDILHQMIEGERSVSDIVASGHDEATVRRVWRLLDRAEYKRRQAPPGVKITPRAFGRDRRYPITNGFTNLVT
ncbi:NAD+ synthase [Thalassospira mesophila]|uniref:Glutamine-dependent NAD(+) synthetase n=1 Tax=Thalassospira mesophila TaxID=1293891 RepID=A0A1Y2L534_9PROT|nr:NAD+ synthase [Thalassospira mesophila]OSQ39643.1 NAD synthetase [Thalassospira mesophila]